MCGPRNGSPSVPRIEIQLATAFAVGDSLHGHGRANDIERSWELEKRRLTMQKGKNFRGKTDKTLAAVCGLFCEACTLFIATQEDPSRLKALAGRFGLSEEEVRCNGCRSDKRTTYCATCTIFACASRRGKDFCSECAEYPCTDLIQFQSERPHRIELWDNLAQIKTMGCEQWLTAVREHYTCPRCRTINSAYDSRCRRCGGEPSCGYVAKHQQAIQLAKKNR